MRTTEPRRSVLDRARTTTTYARLARYPELLRFIRFGMVGAVNTVIYFALFNLCLWLGLQTNLSAGIAFVVASFNSYFLNKAWTFRDPRRTGLVAQYGVFLFFTLIGLAVNQAAITLFLIPLGGFGVLGKNLAAAAALPFHTAWNFYSYRRWTFTSAPRAISET